MAILSNETPATAGFFALHGAKDKGWARLSK
jgi:hypothetical protein